MQHKKIPFQDLASIFSGCFLDYIQQKSALTDLYHRFPRLNAFEEQIAEKKKSFPAAYRDRLYTTLKKQYAPLVTPKTVADNIEALRDKNTFTITTGHQLNIFTGPLYVIYKIASTINLCKQLQKKYSNYTFIPVYWMASEDHDFKEINHFRIYGKKYTWETNQQGAVGQFNPQDLKAVLDKVPGDIKLFQQAYLKHNRLSDAVRYYINELFGKEGLLVVDGNCHTLKVALQKIMKDDLFEHTPLALVEKSNRLLKKNGYASTIHARKINFFYLDNNVRGRLDWTKNRFSVPSEALTFEKDCIKKVIEQEPEKLSPNVVIRPLYQEIILPNLAYIGGPAEIVYWFQLKRLFDNYKVPFPILVPRSFTLVIDGPTARKLKKTALTEKDLFKSTHQLHKQWVKKNSAHKLTLNQEKENIKLLFEEIEKVTTPVDTTLTALVRAEARRAIASLEKIERKLLRAEKRKHTDKMRQIDAVKETLFPNGNLQERTDNFLTFYQQDPYFIQKILAKSDPLDFRFNVLSYPFS